MPIPLYRNIAETTGFTEQESPPPFPGSNLFSGVHQTNNKSRSPSQQNTSLVAYSAANAPTDENAPSAPPGAQLASVECCNSLNGR